MATGAVDAPATRRAGQRLLAQQGATGQRTEELRDPGDGEVGSRQVGAESGDEGLVEARRTKSHGASAVEERMPPSLEPPPIDHAPADHVCAAGLIGARLAPPAHIVTSRAPMAARRTNFCAAGASRAQPQTASGRFGCLTASSSANQVLTADGRIP